MSTLNKALGDEWLEVDRESVALRKGPNLWVDVTAFQQKSAESDGDIPALEEAVRLYQGDFMAGFTLADCPDFDEWQYFEGNSLRRSLAGALSALVAWYEKQHEFDTAIAHTRRWVSLDPLDEHPHYQLMHLYTWADQSNAALRQYEEYAQLLSDELDATVTDELTDLYLAIKRRQPPPPPERSPMSTLKQTAVTHVPTSNTPFIGRQDELDQISRRPARPELPAADAGGARRHR